MMEQSVEAAQGLPAKFFIRPSAAGAGYDASPGGSNLGPTSQN
jgi:hypothetical protein